MKSTLGILAAFFFFSGFIACSGDKQPVKDSLPPTVSTPPGDSIPPPPPVSPPPPANLHVEARTFEVKDSTGKSKGWGYDLYVEGKRTIHQVIIPAVSGTNSFATQDAAQRTGNLAAAKMSRTGDLPTITPKELDSLGVLKK